MRTKRDIFYACSKKNALLLMEGPSAELLLGSWSIWDLLRRESGKVLGLERNHARALCRKGGHLWKM